MRVLDRTSIQELIRKPENSSEIAKAIEQEDRIRFHVEKYLDARIMGRAVTDFMDMTRSLVKKDKFQIFQSLFRYPTPCITETNTAFKDLKRVLGGRNPSHHYEFTDKSYAADWEQYRSKNLCEPEIWQSKGWEQFRTSINSVLVVDLPSEQTTDKPEPYFYWLDIRSVHSYCFKQSNEPDNAATFEYIMFNQPDKRMAYMDSKFSRVYQLNEKREITGVISEVEHGLGYCPARFFWTEPISSLQPGVKCSPITAELGNLDWFLFYKTSKKHLDLYASYPIYSAYAADCDFANGETGSYCDGGFLRDSSEDYIMTHGGLTPCPVCADKNLAGAGSFVEVPVPTDSTDVDLRDPVTITTIDKSSLDYNNEEVRRLADDIHKGIVGVGGEVTQKQSINTQQVSANFESRVSVLNDLKMNWEAAIKFANDTCCKYRYGSAFIESNISLGTEFYVYSADDLYLKYKQAKSNGASEAELDALNDKIISAEYKDDPAMMQRMLVLRHLEPYRHYTLAELIQLANVQGAVDPELLKIKINFNDFVQRFERENTNVIEFGAKTDLASKVKTITAKFKEYGNEQQSTQPTVKSAKTEDGDDTGREGPSD